MLLLLLLTSAFVLLPWAGAGRIIGGREAKRHSRPYMAYLIIQHGSGTSTCGGFLIRSDAVLSAAHCADKIGIVKITVILGAHNINDREQSQQRVLAKDWVIHENYSPVDFKNDIMLVKLDTEAKINKYVRLISIPSHKESVRTGAACKVAGWGLISVTRMKTDVLREVELKVQNEAICQHQFQNYQQQSMICVGDASNKKLVYDGDSGGPLVCNRKAHGIVSHRHKYCLFPEVFTRISFFEPWIRKQLKRFALQEVPGSPSSD
ncbi:cathepsin G-like [Prinia subflava]|uniref:cathepsin G-like n=1 Tax=Prinia subflava TaxID=208062 RepID=UPI002FDFC002